jgi:hypothetical protein
MMRRFLRQQRNNWTFYSCMRFLKSTALHERKEKGVLLQFRTYRVPTILHKCASDANALCNRSVRLVLALAFDRDTSQRLGLYHRQQPLFYFSSMYEQVIECRQTQRTEGYANGRWDRLILGATVWTTPRRSQSSRLAHSKRWKTP